MPLYDSARVAAALPGYTLGDPLGVGASGLVIAGWHHGLQRDVAVKILHRAPDRPAAGFATEARLLAGLDHPHVVRVYDFVEKDDFSLLVMEKLSGGTLRSRQPTLTPPAACAVGLATSAALAYAHTRGVLHRDIKPDNILFDSAGLPKVADFGIARAVNDSGPATSTVIGTPLYMAPEQLAGGRLRPATDVYALGVVLYEMLTGVHPADQGQLAGDESGPPAPPDVPHRLAVVLAGALARDPLERTGSAHAFAFDLARAAALEFGSDWLSRSGMSIQVDHELLVTAALVPPGALTSSVGAGSGGGPP
ncbi:serine/threonine-protein kinase, partial [Frankia sp. EI5c]|uniref:serine/threonine-protein kinase n=1 Tax=Frankia sp. EI5c TaxID=683316 RepID=UPI001F5B1D1D